jgi:SAM-dependent methyltransferase
VFDGAKIIELGGASSRLLVDFAKNNNAQVTAVDYSDTGVAQTKELFQREGLNGEVLHEDIFKWAAGGVDRSFDVVTHWGLLEHFADPEPIMKISANLVRPGGKVVFTMPNLGAKGVSLWRRYSPENLKAHVYHDDQAIAASARAAGLVLEKKFHCGAPMVRMAPLEKRSIGAFIVNIVHTGLTLAGAVFPSLYTRGIADVSNTRGFVLRKP